MLSFYALVDYVYIANKYLEMRMLNMKGNVVSEINELAHSLHKRQVSSSLSINSHSEISAMSSQEQV